MDLLRSAEIWQYAFVAIVGVVGIFALFKSHRSAMLIIGGMLFIAGLGLTKEISQGGGAEYRTFLFPLQVRRAYAYSGLGAALMMALFLHAARIRLDRTSVITWIMLLAAVFMGGVHFIHDKSEGAMSIVVALLTFVPFTILLPTLVDTWEELYTPARGIALTGGAWTMACTIQFLLNKSVILSGGERRFCGMLGNPQHAAVFCSAIAVFAIWLGINDPKMKLRPLWIAIGASHVVFTAWTGSRTGALCLTTGAAVALMSRLGRVVLLGPVIVGAVIGLVTLAESMGVQFGFERLLNTANTRTGAWNALVEQVKQSPIIGVGPSNQQYSENSFLLAWSSFGVGAFLLQLLIFLVSIGVGIRLLKQRFASAPERRPMYDLIGAMVMMYWLGGMFEGYGASRISTQPVIFVLVAAMSARALAIPREEALAAAEGGEWDADAPSPDSSVYDGYEWYGDELPPARPRDGTSVA